MVFLILAGSLLYTLIHRLYIHRGQGNASCIRCYLKKENGDDKTRKLYTIKSNEILGMTNKFSTKSYHAQHYNK